MTEDIIVIAIISAALFWAIKSAYSKFAVKNNPSCGGGCSGCSCRTENKSGIVECKK